MTEVEMPRFRCHKEVSAFKIESIRPIVDGGAALSGMGLHVQVDRDYVERHKPSIGGYYIQYEDGYKSWSPAKAFEDGYTRI